MKLEREVAEEMLEVINSVLPPRLRRDTADLVAKLFEERRADRAATFAGGEGGQ